MVSDGDSALLLSCYWTVCYNKVDESLEVVFSHLSVLNPVWEVHCTTSPLGKEAWQGHRVDGVWFNLTPEGKVLRTVGVKGRDSRKCGVYPDVVFYP